jgi:hypothetical protein
MDRERIKIFPTSKLKVGKIQGSGWIFGRKSKITISMEDDISKKLAKKYEKKLEVGKGWQSGWK